MRRICLAILGLTLLAAPVAASDGKEAAARALEAAQALQQQALQAAAAGKRLNLTAAPASEHLRRIFDAKAFAALPPAAASDMSWIIDWMGAVRITNYTLLNSGAEGPIKLDHAALAGTVREYEDQIAVAITFQQRLFPRALESMYEFFQTLSEAERTPVRLEGLEKMVGGYLDSVRAAICFAGDSTIKPTNARMIAAAMRESAELLAEMTEPDTRKEFVNLLTLAQQQTTHKEAAQHLRAIQAALQAAKS